MALTILGLSGALSHDPSAALYIDGKLVAAAEEERFVRDKHAKNRMPYESAKFCLEQAGIKPSDVDVVAIPFAPISLFGKARWQYAKRYWYAPSGLRPEEDQDRAGRAPPGPRFQCLPLLRFQRENRDPRH